MGKQGYTFIGTRDSTLDWWSLVHFAFFLFVASSVEAIFRLWPGRWWVHLIWWATLSVAWEGFEAWAERKWPEKWRGKVEHWSNRWIADPVCNGFGTILGIFVVYR